MTDAVEQLHARSEARWWKTSRSLGDIAEYLERTLKDKQSLEQKLLELLAENNRLARRCAQVESEATRHGRHDAELAARERLLKDEFERKTQELRIEMNKERRELVESVDKLKQDLAGCFCRQLSNERVGPAKKRRLS